MRCLDLSTNHVTLTLDNNTIPEHVVALGGTLISYWISFMHFPNFIDQRGVCHGALFMEDYIS